MTKYPVQLNKEPIKQEELLNFLLNEFWYTIK